ncbi:uncharacterized protein LOC110019135 [Phalaenopsis equestris]|uniref:uncharacterized protein LOC110019135 n=1 Tax=Phalaenopsis equestris TaxID=78828 RepID=UPI0009E433F5|nr:uncharacterized protein LOC110019135 [Phalaenopsis equestris]
MPRAKRENSSVLKQKIILYGVRSAVFDPDHALKQNSSREEFQDWPQTFLAIGTFGNNELGEDSQIAQSSSETQESSHKISDLNIEEVIKFQKEISKLLNLKLSSSTYGTETAEIQSADHSINESVITSLTLEADNTISSLKICKGSTDDSEDSKFTLNKFEHMLSDDCNWIRQRSLPSLLNKMFISRSSFSPQPSLRDSISESKLKKILKKIIHKKIHPRTVSRPPTMKYLQKNNEEDKVEER